MTRRSLRSRGRRDPKNSRDRTAAIMKRYAERLMRRLFIIFAIGLLPAGLPVLAGAELVLSDDQHLKGVSVEKKEGFYLLELETGDVLPVPIELVRELRLTGKDDPPASGLRDAEPETLVGPPGGVDLPRRGDQLRVLQDSTATFRDNLIDPYWRPESDWVDDPSLNNFNPARWYQPPIDPEWKFSSVYKQSEDQTNFNPARWYRSSIESNWWPSDGFDRSSR